MGAVGFGDNRQLPAVMVRGSAAGLSAGKDPGGGRHFYPAGNTRQAAPRHIIPKRGTGHRQQALDAHRRGTGTGG